MAIRQATMPGVFTLTVFMAAAAAAQAQKTGPETFTATAAVKTAAAAAASAPVTITVDRKMSQSEADTLVAAFKTGGVAGLRKALAGVPPTGSVRLGSGTPTPTRLTIERSTDKGRLLTIVADQPILFLGAGVAGAKTKEGYDFAIVDIEVDARGNGSGTLAPAAKVTVKEGVFVVDDYASELIRLNGVSRVK